MACPERPAGDSQVHDVCDKVAYFMLRFSLSRALCHITLVMEMQPSGPGPQGKMPDVSYSQPGPAGAPL